MMLQQDAPEDFVIATGVQVAVRDFIHKAAGELGITLRFEGEGVEERGSVVAVEGDHAPKVSVGDVVVRVDPRYFRPTEVETLLGDPTYARERLGWEPAITLDEMITEMVAHDYEQARRHALLEEHGFAVNLERE